MFEAHSIKGASASAAMKRGEQISDIHSTADWSLESVFQRFYYCPSLDNNSSAWKGLYDD